MDVIENRDNKIKKPVWPATRTGQPVSAETRAKLSHSMSNTPRTETWKNRISAGVKKMHREADRTPTPCPVCGSLFKGEFGLKIHQTTMGHQKSGAAPQDQTEPQGRNQGQEDRG